VNFRYPIFLDVTGKRCLVTGAGFEIPQKVKGLVDASAHVVYVHPHAGPEIQTFAAAGLIEWEQRDFRPDDLDGCFLIVTDHEDNSEIFRLAEERNVLCNAADDPPNCRFSFGSIHRQGELTMAISTNGWAPAVAVRLKEWLQREVGPEYAEFLQLLKALRPEIGERIPDFGRRKELWYRMVDSEALALVKGGDRQRADELLRAMLEESASAA
jgi:precorrin-2 dehydrogenase / sirohydrochlorin ferrochelatase